MSGYIKLAEAPTLIHRAPECSACCVEVTSEDGWLCPVCGTSWGYDDYDDAGTLYEEWSGAEIEAEPVSEDEAMTAGVAYEREKREKIRARWLTTSHANSGGDRG